MQDRNKAKSINRSCFYKLSNTKKLCEYLSSKKEKAITRRKLEQLLCLTPLYTKGTSKKDGRSTDIPNSELTPILEKFSLLLKRIEVPEFVFGIVKEKHKKSKLFDIQQKHFQNSQVWKIDIKQYFYSINGKKVFWFFRQRLKCGYNIAAILTKLSTFDNKLPIGAVHSNVVAYHAMSDMWEKIGTIANNENYTISLFGDDLIISSQIVNENIKNQIKAQIKCHDLQYHKENIMTGHEYYLEKTHKNRLTNF